MRLGLQIPDFTWPGNPQTLGATLASIAENADAAGIYSLWVMDHLFQIRMVGPPEAEMLEGWTALAFMAARTSSIKLGTMVTAAVYRQPGLLIKTATTLDVLSGGRAYLGIGAAWNEDEARGLGIPFPALAERFAILEETLQIAHQMWRNDEAPFHGEKFTLERPLCSPQPLTQPHPPILIGGSGEKKTLRLVARYADACNLFAFDLETVKHKLSVLREHCAAEDRDYDSIEKTGLSQARLDGADDAAAFVEKAARLRDIGIEHLIISAPDIHDPRVIEIMGNDVVPALTALG